MLPPLSLPWFCALLLLSGLPGAPAPAGAQPGGRAEVDMSFLQKPLGSWTRVSDVGGPETARLILYQFRQRSWLLLHWSARVGEGAPATAADAADRASRLTGRGWGPSEAVPSDETHRGHTLWALEREEGGTIRAVRLWYCGRSSRTFAAETLLDRSLETDPRWMDHLEVMAASAACHGPIRPAPPMVPAHIRAVRAPRLSVGLRIPESWQWGRWGEEVTREDGALWSMDTESVGMVLLRRQDDRTGTLREFFQAALESLPVVLAGKDRSVKVVPGEVQNVEDSLYSEGHITVRDPRWDWIAGRHRFVFQAFRARGEYHGMMVSWLSETDIRGRAVVLEPGWERLRRWLDLAKSGYRP
ncbi:MAG: hypothetical protein R6W82_09460 [bacterium]